MTVTTDLLTAVKALGNGSLVTAPDTITVAIWSSVHHLADYVGAFISTVVAEGDCDTNAAIVGGIVAFAVGAEGIPSDWRKQKDLLPFEELVQN